MNQGKSMASLIGLVGGYLLYLAWQLLQDWNNPDTTMSHGLMAFFIAFFAAAACAIFVYAFRLWKRTDQDEKEERKSPADENSLK